ncbi:MAG: dTDP-4-dehydrorhamnose 3,5-epimerase [Candidatus Cloacimonetes bacterium]|nr:dTDP-4-dehydrorhamnose 3,5-epimerase [Candidatus Cloacimonadota bacterium]
MKFIETVIPGLIVIEPEIWQDHRGYFFEFYNKQEFFRAGIRQELIQDNQSLSQYGTIRGLHYQVGKHAQGKLVGVISGRITDVAVDIRFGSPTFGFHLACELSDENHHQLWIPPGFAHGFAVHSDKAIVVYKCTALYARQAERGIIFNDPDLGIKWGIENPIVSDKDRANGSFKDIAPDFIYHEEKQ